MVHLAPLKQVDRLKAELMYERRTSEEQLSHFDDERRVWQEEKEKVNILGFNLFLAVSHMSNSILKLTLILLTYVLTRALFVHQLR